MANVQMLTLLSNFSICLHFFVIKSWGKKYRHTFMNCHLNGVDCSTCQALAEPRRHPTQSRRPSLPRLRSGNPASASLHNALLPNSGEMVPGSQLSAHTGERAPCWQAVLGMQRPTERICLQDSKEVDTLKSQLSASRICHHRVN